MASRQSILCLSVLMAVGQGCGESSSEPSELAPLELRLVSGDAQTATVNTALAQSLVVQAVRNGRPQSGLSVRFVASVASARLEPAEVVTDAEGFASTRLTLSTVAGDVTVEASIEGVETPVVLTATGQADVPDSLVLISGDGQVGPTSVALARPVVVRVEDQFGNPVSGIRLSAEVVEGDSRMRVLGDTDDEGIANIIWTMGTTEGINRAEISAADFGTVLSVSSDAFTPTLTIVGGNDQIGSPGARLNTNPRVRLLDGRGQPRQGVEVTFFIVEGGGSILSSEVRTNEAGDAAVAWILGPTPGINRLRASVQGGSILDQTSVTIVAQGQAPEFDIRFLFVDGEPSLEVREAFNAAADRWEEAITGDLPDVDFRSEPLTGCQVAEPFAERVDDLLITVRIRSISAAGSAGICVLREGSQLPVVSLMNINPTQLDSLRLDELVTHEIGHALGLGTGPRWNNLLAEPTCSTNPPRLNADTHFTGPRAIAAYFGIGGPAIEGRSVVPVENGDGGDGLGCGSLDSHWDQSIFDNALMTWRLSSRGTVLTRVTLGALIDMGYVVNLSAADNARLNTASFLAGGEPREPIELINDVARPEVIVVDPQGRRTTGRR